MIRTKEDQPEYEDTLRFHSYNSSCTHHFKFEHSGMLVYDSKAALICGHYTEPCAKQSPESVKVIAPNTKKELEGADENGNIYAEVLYFKKMKDYTPMPSFQYEYFLEIPNDSVTLRFNSKFESGNLYKAIKLSDYEYLLFIHNDIGTANQNHWYYFSVINPRRTSITFKLANMRKKDTHYITGMQPVVYSKKLCKHNGVKWHRDGNNVQYTENSGTVANNFVGRQKYYTLSFTYQFRYEDDEVFFAYSLPYTHTDLTQYLETVRQQHPSIAEVSQLCKTIAGNVCYKLVITQNIQNYIKNERKIRKKKENAKPKKAVVLMARVHSGETVSSYMMKGAIDYLLSQSAENLRKNYVFYIVPMLNPDGVRYGNYRASLLGVDLNRRWKEPNKVLHPTIYHAKKMIEELKNRHEIMMVCDMHGHTKKKNVFMYGCSIKSPEMPDKEKNLLARVIPYHMGRKNSFFSFVDSHFRIEKSKESTARIVFFQEFEIVHSYTMEASFFGPESSASFKHYTGDMHFSAENLASLGEDLCKCCNYFNSQKIYAKKARQTNMFLKQESVKSEFKEDLPEENIEEEVGSILKENVCNEFEVVDVGVDPESSGSDSDPSDNENFKNPYKKKLVKNQKNQKNHQLSPSVQVMMMKTETVVPSRTPNSTIQPLHAKKQQIFEPEWGVRRTVRMPLSTTFKPQETVSPQSFNFPLQSRFNPFSLEIKLKSEIPELDMQKKVPKIQNSPKKTPLNHGKLRHTDMYLPALLSVNLPEIQGVTRKSSKKQTREISDDVFPREVYHVGNWSLDDKL